MRLQIPAHLKSTVLMLEAAFPAGIPNRAILAVMRVLYDHMSDRALARAMAFVLKQDDMVLLNSVYEAAQLDEADSEVQAAMRVLEKHGLSSWLEED